MRQHLVMTALWKWQQTPINQKQQAFFDLKLAQNVAFRGFQAVKNINASAKIPRIVIP